jgi:hypothetical protein
MTTYLVSRPAYRGFGLYWGGLSPGHDCSRLCTHQAPKKCIEAAIAEDIIAIAHDDDLHFIEDTGMVGPSQNAGIYTQIQVIQLVMHMPRKR